MNIIDKIITSRWKMIGVLLLAVIIPYSNIFPNELVGDDTAFIVEWQQIKRPIQYKELLKGQLPSEHEGTYRPLRSLYYAATQTIFHQNPLYYHLFALLIHLSCTLLVYLITKQLSKNNMIAFFASMLFAVHPIHTEAITFITTSFDIIGIFWGLLTFYFYIKSDRHKLFYVLSLISYILAILSYEITLTIPLILLLYQWLLSTKKKPLDINILSLFPFFYFVCIYFFIRINILMIPSRGGYIDNNFLLSLFLSLRELPIYVIESLIPYHIGLDHFIPPSTYTYNLPQYVLPTINTISLFEPYTLFSIFFLITLLFFFFILKRHNPLISFCIAFLCLSLLPILNIFPGYLIMFEKYLYLGSIASCLMIAALLFFLKKKKVGPIPLHWLLFILILAIFSTKTYMRNFDWRTDVHLWQATTRQSPNNAMVWYQLGSAYQQRKQYQNAIRTYMHALTINDSMYFVHTNLGICYYLTQDTQSALSHLEIATQQYSKAKEAYLYLGKIYIDFQDFGTAAQYLSKAIEISPQYFEAKELLLDTYNRLGNLLASFGQYQQAKQAYQKALDLDPHYQPTITNLDQINKVIILK